MRFTWLVTSLVVLLFISCPAPKNERASFDENNNSVETLLEQNGEQEIEKLDVPDTLEERFSYTYGYLLMMTAMRDVQNISTDYFIRGSLDAALNSEPLIASNLMNTVLYEYQEHLMSEASKRLEELAKKNLEDAESFLAINGQR